MNQTLRGMILMQVGVYLNDLQERNGGRRLPRNAIKDALEYVKRVGVCDIERHHVIYAKKKYRNMLGATATCKTNILSLPRLTTLLIDPPLLPAPPTTTPTATTMQPPTTIFIIRRTQKEADDDDDNVSTTSSVSNVSAKLY